MSPPLRQRGHPRAGSCAIAVLINDGLGRPGRHRVRRPVNGPARRGDIQSVQDTGWTDYWEGLVPKRMFEAESDDYTARLLATGLVDGTSRVLDFGCGFGHTCALLARSVAEIAAWDGAARMREHAATILAGHPNARIVDLSTGVPDAERGQFDLVLVNSVVQYMNRAEFLSWLHQWRALLAPAGVVVVSDVPVMGGSRWSELIDMVRFAAGRGFLTRALVDGFREAARYGRERGQHPLMRLSQADVRRLGDEAGLHMTVLPENLTHRSGRLAAVLG